MVKRYNRIILTHIHDKFIVNTTKKRLAPGRYRYNGSKCAVDRVICNQQKVTVVRVYRYGFHVSVCRQPTHLNYTYSLYVCRYTCVEDYLYKTSDQINIILDLIQSISTLLGNIQNHEWFMSENLDNMNIHGRHAHFSIESMVS